MSGPDHPDRLPEGVVRRPSRRWRADGEFEIADAVAEEVPVALVYNGQPHAVMMATPAHLEELALGFTLSEGIASSVAQVQVAPVEQLLEGLQLAITVPEANARALAQRSRGMAGRSGCGVCGSRLLEDAVRQPPPVRADVRVALPALRRALHELRQGQRLNAVTAATHAAGWARLDGGIDRLREDVGRHNALDKLLGSLHRDGFDPAAGFLVVTSRASYEMAMKAASAGIALMAAISAPTALAVSLAGRAGLTLIGFARPTGHTVYTHPQRLVAEPADRNTP